VSIKRVGFSLTVKQGPVSVNICRVENEGRARFTVFYHADGWCRHGKVKMLWNTKRLS
jgi:hypothetical protein